jgi:hypothetical protein
MQNSINHRGMELLKGGSDLSRFSELEAIVEAIFQKKHHFTLPNGTTLRTRAFVQGTCVGVDYQLHRYIEQNQRNKTDEAARARKGAQIVWVIRTHDPITKEQLDKGLYVGKIEDGTVRMKP